MINVKTIKIAQARGKETNFVVVTKVKNKQLYYHYWLTELIVNKYSKVDIGVWKIKRKK